jgi:hypothetical protein
VLPDEPPRPRAIPSQGDQVPTDGLFAGGPAIEGTTGETAERADDSPLFGKTAPWAPSGAATAPAPEPEAAAEAEATGSERTPRFSPPDVAPALIYGSPPPPGTVPPSTTRSTPAAPIPPSLPDETDEGPRRWWMVAGAAAAVVLVAAGVFVLTRGDDSTPSDTATSPTSAPVSVASETSVKGKSGSPSTTAAAGADADAKCRAALLSDDIARPFQECDAYQYRRLQPEVAPNRQDLDTACVEKTYGDACIFIPTTLPPAPFEPATLSGQGNGSVPLPPVASGGIVEVHYNGADTITATTASGPLMSHAGPYVGRHYVGDMTAAKALQVTATGSWTVVVQPPTAARDATLRAAGDGPDVLRLDNPTEKAVRFTYDGTDHFQVIGHPLLGTDANGAVAVDQTGPVDMTVTLRGALVEIRGTGHWTIIPS